MEKTRATDTEKRHNILEKGRFLLADYCKISVGRICTRSTKYNINWPNYEPNVRKKGRNTVINRAELLNENLEPDAV